MTSYSKKHILFIIQLTLLAIFILMISQPSLTFSLAAGTLIVWYRSVVPTLLPVLIVSNLIVITRAWELLIPIIHPILGSLFHTSPCGSFTIVLGILCGYPMGAKMVSDLYAKKELSYEEARGLLAFTSFPSPMFLNGYILQQCLPQHSLVIPVLIGVYGSAFLIGILRMRFIISPTNNANTSATHISTPVKLTFLDIQQTLLSSAQVLLLVGLYMMLATILAGFLREFLIQLSIPNVTEILPLLSGLLEMTTGISLLPQSTLSTSISASIAIFLCCFGGLSIALQTSAVLPKEVRWFPHYLFWKIVHGIVAVVILQFMFLIS